MFGPTQAPQATALVFGGMAAEVQGKAVSLSRSPSRPKPAARHQPSTVPPCPSAAASQPDHVDVRTPHSTPWWVSRAAHPPPRAPLLVKRALKVAAVSPPTHSGGPDLIAEAAGIRGGQTSRVGGVARYREQPALVRVRQLSHTTRGDWGNLMRREPHCNTIRGD